MPDNKKHHYVPVFYMKLFSTDKKSINLFNIKQEKKIARVPLRNQCYRDYFYGETGKEEKALGLIEASVATSIKRLIDSEKIPEQTHHDFSNILIFLLLQSRRTAYQADALNEMTDKLIKHVLGPQIEQEMPGIDLSELKIRIKKASNIAVKSALISYIMLIDMKWVLVKVPSKIEFITSDTPVIFINPLLGESNGLSNAGITAKGLIIICPLSPNFSLILYDQDVYRLHGVKSSELTAVASSEDVAQLNIIQVASSYENFYFCSEDSEVDSIYHRAKKYRRKEKSRQRVFPQAKNLNERSELIVTNEVGVNYPLDLSFLVTKKDAKRWMREYLKLRYRPSIVERDPTLSSIHKDYLDLEMRGVPLPPISDFFKERLKQI